MSVAQRIATTLAQIVSVVLALVPLVVALLLLRQFSQVVLALDTPTTGPWRFDPLTLLGCVILALGAVRPRPLRVGVRLALAVLGAMVAIVATDPAIQLLALVLASLVVANQLRAGWFVALVAFAAATFGPRLSAFPPSLVVPLTILAALAGSGVFSWRGRHEAEAVLAPFWMLFAFRSLTLEPWPVATVVGASGVATLLIVLLAWRILRGDPAAARDHTLAALLMMALLALAQNTILGIVAALWVLVMHGFFLVVAGERDRVAPLGIVVIAVGTAAWWSAGAVAGAGGFLGVGTIVLVSIAASMRTLVANRARWSWVTSGVLLLLLVVATPWLTTTLLLPVTAQLGAGLTAPGLLDAWPWIGTSGMDAGHRRVTLLPAAVLLCLFVVIWAVVWLVGRVRGFAPSRSVASVDAAAWERMRARVWWLR